MAITHTKVSAISDSADGSLVQPSDWNDDHVIGTLGAATATSINFGDEALSAYDEGLWTVTLGFDTDGDLSVAYSTQTATYTRVGRLVHCMARVVTSTFTHSTASGAFRVRGLPFTAAAVTALSGSVAVGGWTDTNISNIVPVVSTSATNMRLLASRSGAAVKALTTAEFPTGASVDIYLSISYYV